MYGYYTPKKKCRMSRRTLFIISLLLILSCFIAVIHFFGGTRSLIAQAVHITLLCFTCFIGYINWKNEERWVHWVWFSIYAGVFLTIVGTGLLSLIINHNTLRQLIALIVKIRNIFEGPLPFLVFSILVPMSRQFSNQSKT